MPSGGESPCEVFIRLAWLIPFAYAIVKLGVQPKPSELSNVLGTRSAVAKAAIRRLKLAGLLAGSNLKPEAAACLEGVRVLGKRYVWRIGANYILVVVKRSRVAVYTVPADVVEAVKSSCLRSVRELSHALSLQPLLVSRALRVLEVLNVE